MKLYIVVAVWEATKDNHAGMYHLAKQFKEKAKIPVQIIKIPTTHLHYLFWLYCLYTYLIGIYLRIVVKPNDTVWLMEYLLVTLEQSSIARMLKGRTNVVGIAHLVPALIDKCYSDKSIKRKIGYLNKLYVLGSSLKAYFIKKGILEDKVKTTYHYVDNDFYNPIRQKELKGAVKVISMGNMQRNFDELRHIISSCPSIQFTVCMGRKNISSIFKDLDNVQLVGYIPEDELLHLMQMSHLSLNVMNDTIGSNVITTSLAVGLPVIASNVGSIGDYITDGVDGKLFNSLDEAITILNQIADDREVICQMKEKALEKARQISIDSFISDFLEDNNLN